MKNNIKTIVGTGVILTAALLAGCGKAETDPASTEVLKLSLSPSPLPTESPQYIDPDAVTSKGSVSMVNEYLNQKSREKAEAAEKESSGEEDGNSEE